MSERSNYPTLSPAAGGQERWFAKVVCAGPGGEEEDPDFTDERYWVKRCFPSNTDRTEALLLEEYPEEHTLSEKIVAATNLAETLTHSHTLPEGQYVWVESVGDRSEVTDPPSVRRYVFTMVTAAFLVALVGDFNAAGTIPAASLAAWRCNTWRVFNSPTVDNYLPPMLFWDVVYFQETWYGLGTFYLWPPPDELEYTTIVRWNTETEDWDDVDPGDDLPPSGMMSGVVHQDELYFCTATIHTKPNLWRWDGLRLDPLPWVYIGANKAAPYDMVEWQGDLYVCAEWGSAIAGVFKWTGSDWEQMGGDFVPGGVAGASIYALCAHDDGRGGGEQLYAAGRFGEVDGTPAIRIARWNGDTWSAVGTGLISTVWAMASTTEDEKPYLYAGGTFVATPSGFPIYYWDGFAWQHFAKQLHHLSDIGAPAVYAIASLGSSVVFGGEFHRRAWDVGRWPADHIAVWNEAEVRWVELSGGTDGVVRGMCCHSGWLYVVGEFSCVGEQGQISARRIARVGWVADAEHPDGFWKWETVTPDLWNTARAVVYWSGFIYVGGQWDYLGRVVGSTVENITSIETGSSIMCMSSHGNLWIGGDFQLFEGTRTKPCLVSWDGSTGTARAGIIQAEDGFPAIHCMAWNGSDLYVGGNFDVIGGVSAHNVARLRSGSWAALDDGSGEGVDGPVHTLSIFNGDVYVGGSFLYCSSGTISSAYLALFEISSDTWSAPGYGSNVQAPVRASITCDAEGAGDECYVGVFGDKTPGYTVDAYSLFNFSTSGMTIFGWPNASVNDEILACFFGEAGTGASLFIGGRFTKSGSRSRADYIPEMCIARASIAKGVTHFAGGIGNDPTFESMSGIGSGTVYAIRRLQEPDSRCFTIAVAGSFSCASRLYAERIALLTARGWRRCNGGVYGAVSSWTPGPWRCKLTGGLTLFVGGNIGYCYNEIIDPADEGTVDELVACAGVARFDGKYWRRMGDGVPDFVRAIEYVDGTYYAAGGATGVCVWNEHDETWDIIDPLVTGPEFHDMIWFDEQLWIGGLFYISTSSCQAARSAGGSGSFVEHSPNFDAGTLDAVFAVGSVGGGEDRLYIGGTASPGHGNSAVQVWNESTTAWVNVGGTNLVGIVYDITFLDGKLYAVGEMAIGGAACQLVEWDGTSWTVRAETPYDGRGGSFYCCHADSLGHRVWIGGDFWDIDTEDWGQFLIAYDPVADDWIQPEHGSVNQVSMNFGKQ